MLGLGRARALMAAGMLAALTGSLGGCSDNGPSGQSTIVNDIYIGGDYYFIPAGPLAGMVNGAMIVVRDGGDTGPVVTDLSVEVNGQELSFDESTGYYTGIVDGLASGDDVTISVSDGLGTVSQTVQVPYAPSDLQLVGGAWDITGSSSTNQLTWNNPATVGQAIAINIYDYDGLDADRIYWGAMGNTQATFRTLSNSELDYYATLTSVAAIVAHSNYAFFSGNPDASAVVVLGCATGTWPVGGP
jgi:hypothetical protein